MLLNVKDIDSDVPHNFGTYSSFDAMPTEMATKCMLLDAAQDNDGFAIMFYFGSRQVRKDAVYYVLSTRHCRAWMSKAGYTIVSMKEE